MRIFLPPLEIGDTEGFAPEKDIFGRAVHGKRLTNLLDRVDQPLVIAVDAQWGGGKTTFLKMWAGELRNAGFPVIFFDAFEHDYTEDAFAALAAEVVGLSTKLHKSGEAKAKQFLHASLKAGKVLIRSGLKVGIKAATVGALAAEDLEDIGKEIGAELSSIEDKYLGALLTQQQIDQDAITAFRSALSQLPAILAKAGASETKPLVFIIDELDRCKPNFALDLLERIKHFFTVPNVHFVLGVHTKQLSTSVKLAYGQDVDADTYLQKFISLTFHLIDRERYEHEETTARFIQYVTKAMEFDARDKETIGNISPLIRHVANTDGLSLRTIERIFNVLAIALAFSPANFFRPAPIIAGLSILKVVRPDLFAKAKRGVLKYEEVKSTLGFGRDDVNDWYVEFWKIALGQIEPSPEWRSSFFRYHIDTKDIVPVVANDVIDRMMLPE
jgi:hypothetical protein